MAGVCYTVSYLVATKETDEVSELPCLVKSVKIPTHYWVIKTRMPANSCASIL
jgi:hypothetical protein